jgi:hypothetical protein
MERGMRILAAGLVLGVAVVSAGCAWPERKTEAELLARSPWYAMADNNGLGEDAHQITGSRIPKSIAGDRTLKAVGSRDARDAMDTSARPLNANGTN